MIASFTPEYRQQQALAATFDALAPRYDALWSDSLIGRLQREQVYRILLRSFRPGEHVLELGCGTGIDAARLAGMGIRVLATDVSPAMVEIARSRIDRRKLRDLVTFEVCAAERISSLQSEKPFDGAFSNFGAFNCIADPGPTSSSLVRLIRPGGRLIVCLMGRFCLWETAWHLLHAMPDKAFRRLRAGPDGIESSVEPGIRMRVHYHSIKRLAASLSGGFDLVAYRGVGVFVPPSYLEELAVSRRYLFTRISLLDERLGALPILRGAGDHVLAIFVRRKRDGRPPLEGA